MSAYQDQIIKCACGNEFTFTARDQEFYAMKGYTPPKRCYPCRDEKKAKFAEADKERERKAIEKGKKDTLDKILSGEMVNLN